MFLVAPHTTLSGARERVTNMQATPMQLEFRNILQHIANAERLASSIENETLLEALREIESSVVDAMFDNAI